MPNGIPAQDRRPRIYLAGPEVFLPEALAVAAAKKAICEAHGCEGVFPLDNEIDPAGLTPQQFGLRISVVNEQLIGSCDAVIANLTPFRGISADVGTVYELGLAAGLGKRIFAYTNVKDDFAFRTIAAMNGQTARDTQGCLRDPAGLLIEDFGLHDNLMLEGGLSARGGRLVVGASVDSERFSALGAFTECVRDAAKALIKS